MDRRIITLLPSATEIVASLGLTSELVGRSHECDYPPSIQQLPVCTSSRLNPDQPSRVIDAEVHTLLQSTLSIYQLKVEVIEELKPTHIITQDQCDVCAVSFSLVEKAVNSLISTRPQLISLQPNSLSEIWQDIARVGTILEVPWQETLDNLQHRVNNITRTLLTPPTVVALEWIEPLMGAGSWIPELIEIAGGISLLSSKGGACPYLTWESLAEADPDLIIIMPCGFDLPRTKEESQVLMNHPSWGKLKAVQQGKVFITDGNAYFNRPGPRLVDSLEILGEILQPDHFNFGYLGEGYERLPFTPATFNTSPKLSQ